MKAIKDIKESKLWQNYIRDEFKNDDLELNTIAHTYSLNGEEKDFISVTQLLQKHKITKSYDSVDKELLKRAAERGTLIHSEVQDYIENGTSPFTPEGARIVTYLNNTIQYTAVEDLAEVKLRMNPDVCPIALAGTADIIRFTKDDDDSNSIDLEILDVKTGSSKDVWGWTWQLNLYKEMLESMLKQGGKVPFVSMKVLWVRVDENGDAKLEEIPIHNISPMVIGSLLSDEQNGLIYSDKAVIDEALARDVANRWESIKSLEENLKKQKEELEQLKEQIRERMLEEEIKSTSIWGYKFTVVLPSKRETLDTKALKTLEPEIYEKYKKVTEVGGGLKITETYGEEE